MRSTCTAVLGALAALAAGCGRSEDGIQTPAGEPRAPAAVCPDAASVALTVKNVQGRCAVVVGTAAASSAVAQTVCVPPGPVALSATPQPGSLLGPKPWHGTDGDLGAGDPGTVSPPGPSTATRISAAAGTSACVWVCCTLPDGGGCPAANQCP